MPSSYWNQQTLYFGFNMAVILVGGGVDTEREGGRRRRAIWICNWHLLYSYLHYITALIFPEQNLTTTMMIPQITAAMMNANNNIIFIQVLLKTILLLLCSLSLV